MKLSGRLVKDRRSGRGLARHGEAWLGGLGRARRGLARPGGAVTAGNGWARRGMVRRGDAWHGGRGKAGQGLARSGADWSGAARRSRLGWARHGTARQGQVRRSKKPLDSRARAREDASEIHAGPYWMRSMCRPQQPVSPIAGRKSSKAAGAQALSRFEVQCRSPTKPPPSSPDGAGRHLTGHRPAFASSADPFPPSLTVSRRSAARGPSVRHRLRFSPSPLIWRACWPTRRHSRGL